MDSIKQNLPKIVVGTVGAAALTYILYKLLTSRGGAAVTASSLKVFTQAIDQKLSYSLKQQHAHE